MALYNDEPYRDGEVSIGIPIPARIRQSLIADDVAEDVESALSWALQDERVCYFSVHRQEEIVGQIYLHDIDWQRVYRSGQRRSEQCGVSVEITSLRNQPHL